jgi:hypothetical protein
MIKIISQLMSTLIKISTSPNFQINSVILKNFSHKKFNQYKTLNINVKCVKNKELSLVKLAVR